MDPRPVIAPLVPSLLPVPAEQTGICECCRGPAKSGFSTCFQCDQAEGSCGILPNVLPISMAVSGEQLHHVLRSYKDGVTAQERNRSTLQLAALLAVFLGEHASCIGPFDVVTGVPSPRGVRIRPILARISALDEKYQELLTLSRPRPSRAVDPLAYDCPDLTGQRVLLIDDTFASGASVLSAVGRLKRSRAKSITPLVIGRFLNPNWGPTAELLEWLRAEPWVSSRCARCGGAQDPMPELF